VTDRGRSCVSGKTTTTLGALELLSEPTVCGYVDLSFDTKGTHNVQVLEAVKGKSLQSGKDACVELVVEAGEKVSRLNSG